MGHKITVVGMDPSMRNFGIARCLVDIDTLEVEVEYLNISKTEDQTQKVVRKNSDDVRRARESYGAMLLATNGAHIAIAEIPVGSQSARAMASYGMCVGVIAACPIPLIEVTASEVKMIACGSKNASKQEMIEWAVDKYPDANWIMVKRGGKMVPTAANEHLADAVAAVHAGVQTAQFKQAAAIYRSMSKG